MTEAEWKAATSPDELIPHLGEKRSRRKSRLLACACCRRMGEFIPAEFREMLATAEKYADRQAKKSELPSHIKKFRHLDRAAGAVALVAHKHGSVESLRMAMAHARWVLAANGRGRHFGEPLAAEGAVQADLLRDIFGNPFRHVALSPEWLTSDVLALATGIYEERAFDRMPILADALMDAGCDNDDILNHCRQPSEHIRGCWVVDLMLGKS
jgi:hypothetical protein